MFGAAIYGLITLQPLFLQTLLGYTALDAGLTVAPRGIGALFALFLVGALIGKLGGRQLAAFGFRRVLHQRVHVSAGCPANRPGQHCYPEYHQRVWHWLYFCAVDNGWIGNLAQ